MTALTLERPASAANTAAGTAVDTGIIDCDIHPKVRSLADLRPYLSERWWEHLQTYGPRARHGFARGMPFPKATPLACRRDAWPASGGEPGSDLALMRAQLLDPYDVRLGILNPLTPTGQGFLNPDFSAAMCRATNHWQIEQLVAQEPRLRASIVVPYEDGPAARAEIEHWAGHPGFAQVLLLSRTAEPLGQRRYWPIYEAAAAAGLPVGIHVFGYSGWSTSGAGWASFYIEEMTEHAGSCQAGISSLVCEGVLERLPELKIVVIEAGFAWLPALAWRLDRAWARNRSELADLQRPPSEQIRAQVWLTSQPMEEPEIRAHLADVVDWQGADRIMFASDYPHWDFDDPHEALKAVRDPDIRQKIRFDNACELFVVTS